MNLLFLTFQSILITLILTILIELGILKLLQTIFKTYNFQYLWISIIAINLATNPVFNLLSSILDPVRQLYLLEIIFELIIVVVEAEILYLIYKKDRIKFYLLSMIINIGSYGFGLVLFPF